MRLWAHVNRRRAARGASLILSAIVLVAAISLATGFASAAQAATLEGTWEIPNDATNDPTGCTIYVKPECTSLYVGSDRLEITEDKGTLSGYMYSGYERVGSLNGEDREGHLRIAVGSEVGFYTYDFDGSVSADGNTMGGKCPSPGLDFSTCFYWSNGEENEISAWDATRVGAKSPTATAVQCPGAGAGMLRCTATVTASNGGVPTGSVTFSAPAGSFAASSCTLEAVAGGAACSVGFTSPMTSTGPYKITASYAGNTEFEASQATFTPVTGVSIAGATVEEPVSGSATANFTVSLSAASSSAVSVEYESLNGTGAGGAVAPEMYGAVKGTLTFEPGETTQTIPVQVNAAGFMGQRTFSVKLANVMGASLETAQATGTIVGSSALQVTVAMSSSTPDIQENERGPIPQQQTATVTVKDLSSVPIENVVLPGALTIGWHGPAPINALPIKQVGGPMGGGLELARGGGFEVGTLQPGVSTPVQYTVQVEGDGQFDVQALVTGSEAGASVHALGKTTIEPTSQLLFEKNTLAAEVHSLENPALIKAGTHFLIRVQLEDRSYVKRLQIDPYYAGLSGNAIDGALVPENETTTLNAPDGSLAEVEPTPVIVLAPQEKRTFYAVVGTTASDAFSKKATGGGTRATVTFATPELSTLDAADTPTGAAADRTVIAPGSQEFQIGIDESSALAPPPSYWEAQYAYSKGVAFGLWGLTYGAVRGVWDLGVLGFKGINSLGKGIVDEGYYMSELWHATEKDPAARQALIDAIQTKVETAFAEAPWLLQNKGVDLYNAIDNAVGAYFTKIANAWEAGDWREAITDATETGVNVAATLTPLALEVAPGVLTRIAPVEEAWEAAEAAKYARAGEALEAVAKTVEPASEAIAALDKVPAGYVFKISQLRKYVGMSEAEGEWLSNFTRERKVSVVLRSRAEESIAWLKEGAMLKPSWIKSKNVTWADVEFFGYSPNDVGRVVMRKLPGLGEVKSSLVRKGIAEGTPEYETAIERWTERNSTYTKEIKQMEGWNKQREIKGKWPWGESGVDPTLQADELKEFKFRLAKDKHDPHALVPEVYDPVRQQWGSITGDIDLVSVTKADGSSFTQEEYVKILKELAGSPLGIQHPDSTVWIKDGKFWFAKKKDYLASKGNVEFGADGEARSVEFNEKASDPESWTQFAYRIFWDGGYAVGSGQVP